jgi:hypothetical protein
MLSQFTFEVKFIKGIENKVADFLSRLQQKDLDTFKNGLADINLILQHDQGINDDSNQILTEYNQMLHNITDTEILHEHLNLLDKYNHRYLTYYNDKYLLTDPFVIERQQQFINSKFKDDVSSMTTTSSLSSKRRARAQKLIAEKKRKEEQKQKHDEDLIDKIDDILSSINSDHESSEDETFRYEDIQRNHAILQDEITAEKLLEATNNVPNLFNKNTIRINQQADTLAKILIEIIQKKNKQLINDLPQHMKYMVRNNKIWINNDNIIMVKLKNEKERYYTPKNHRIALIRYFHESPLKNHQGSNAVIKDIKEQFYWPKMEIDIKQYINYCNVCQKSKRGPNKKYGLQKLWSSKYFNHVIAIDHKGPLRRTKSGNRYITTIIDRFSGYIVCIAIPRINSYTTAWNIINYWIARFDVPYGILSDQGSDFMSGIIQALCTMLGMKHKISSAYNPQTNGKVERFNRILSESLKVIANERQLNFHRHNSTWDLYLHL